MMTVRDTQMVRDQKKFENHCSTRYVFCLLWPTMAGYGSVTSTVIMALF